MKEVKEEPLTVEMKSADEQTPVTVNATPQPMETTSIVEEPAVLPVPKSENLLEEPGPGQELSKASKKSRTKKSKKARKKSKDILLFVPVSFAFFFLSLAQGHQMKKWTLWMSETKAPLSSPPLCLLFLFLPFLHKTKKQMKTSTTTKPKLMLQTTII